MIEIPDDLIYVSLYTCMLLPEFLCFGYIMQGLCMAGGSAGLYDAHVPQRDSSLDQLHERMRIIGGLRTQIWGI